MIIQIAKTTDAISFLFNAKRALKNTKAVAQMNAVRSWSYLLRSSVKSGRASIREGRFSGREESLNRPPSCECDLTQFAVVARMSNISGY
jgi:hypothetical protein